MLHFNDLFADILKKSLSTMHMNAVVSLNLHVGEFLGKLLKRRSSSL